MHRIKTFICSLSVILMVGCQQKPISEAHLLQNPALLNKEIEKCDGLSSKTMEQFRYCQSVLNAGRTFNALWNERREDPEKFGERIIIAQSNLITLRQSYVTLKQQLQSGSKAQQDAQLLQSKLAETRKHYEEACNEVKTLLAVIGVNSPE